MSSSGRGESAEFVAFLHAMRVRARRLIGTRLRRVVGSSDLLQETLLIAVRRSGELSGRPPRVVLAWLLQAMQFRLMRYVRDHRDELSRPAGELATSRSAALGSSAALGRMVRSEIRGTLLGLIETLPEAERHVVSRLYQGRASTAEVAAELGRSEGAVRALHQRALRRLRERWGEGDS